MESRKWANQCFVLFIPHSLTHAQCHCHVVGCFGGIWSVLCNGFSCNDELSQRIVFYPKLSPRERKLNLPHSHTTSSGWTKFRGLAPKTASKCYSRWERVVMPLPLYLTTLVDPMTVDYSLLSGGLNCACGKRRFKTKKIQCFGIW